MDEQHHQSRNGSKKKAIAVGLALVVAVALFALATIATPRAQANSITNFFGRLFSFPSLPFTNGPSGSATPSGTATSTQLYQPVAEYEQSVVNAVQQASPAVVSIVISENVPTVQQCPYNPFGDLPPEFQQFFGNGNNGSSGFTEPCDTGQTELQQVGGGSGFIVSSDGLILTNRHVVSDTSASYTVITNDGKQYKATVLARDPDQDLAVVKIDASNLPTVTLGDSSGLELGETAIAIGNALGQFSNTVSVGVVSGLERTVTASAPDTGAEETISNVIQTDAAINPGNSGGPLLNLEGQVIGINTAVASNAQNIGFAIPIDQAKHDISSVESTGKIQTAYLGVRYIPVTPDIAQSQNLPVNYGALVRGDSTGSAVVADSPAAKAGIQAEDIVTAVNGTSLQNNDLAALISQYNPGTTVALTVNRGGKTITVSVTLGTRPAGS